MIYALVTFCLFGTTLAQVPGIGSCPDVETVKDFDVSRYVGRWYEAERYFAAFELNANCVTADYSLGDNGTINVVNAQISGLTGNPSSIDGVARVPDPAEPAKLKVKFSSVPFGIEGDYWVVGTDYDSFAVVFSCNGLGFANIQFAWILTRDRNPSTDVIGKADRVIATNGINRYSFSKTTQTGCDSS